MGDKNMNLLLPVPGADKAAKPVADAKERK
jgi:hypothetical protein